MSWMEFETRLKTLPSTMVDVHLIGPGEPHDGYIKVNSLKILADMLNFPFTSKEVFRLPMSLQEKRELFYSWLVGCRRWYYTEYWYMLNDIYSKYQDDLYASNLDYQDICIHLHIFYKNNIGLLELLNDYST